MKRNLVVFFGGRSVEHDVSVITAAQVIQNADVKKYEVIPIYISQDGSFHYVEKESDTKEFLMNIAGRKTPVQIDSVNGTISIKKSFLSFAGSRGVIKTIDVAFPAFHGTYGEDGSFQGMLELANVPYVGSGVAASAVGMNKVLFKELMSFHKIPILPWQVIPKTEIDDNFKVDLNLNYPAIVKPANLGSSIGIKKVSNDNEIREALKIIFHLDNEAVAEPYIEDIMEVNCSILGNLKNNQASVCEQPLSEKEVLSFEDKYLAGGKGTKNKLQGMASQGRKIPAPISLEQTKQIQNLAQDVFRYCGCSGVARIDFLINRKDGSIYVNEINTIPGSLSFYLWEASGMSFRELIDELVDIADKNFANRNSLQRTFESALLKKFL